MLVPFLRPKPHIMKRMRIVQVKDATYPHKRVKKLHDFQVVYKSCVLANKKKTRLTHTEPIFAEGALTIPVNRKTSTKCCIKIPHELIPFTSDIHYEVWKECGKPIEIWLLEPGGSPFYCRKVKPENHNDIYEFTFGYFGIRKVKEQKIRIRFSVDNLDHENPKFSDGRMSGFRSTKFYAPKGASINFRTVTIPTIQFLTKQIENTRKSARLLLCYWHACRTADVLSQNTIGGLPTEIMEHIFGYILLNI